MSVNNGPPSPAAGAACPTLSARRLVPLLVLVAVSVGVIAVGWHRHLSFEEVASHHEALRDFITRHELQALAAYVALYVVAVALSMPVGFYLTVIGGILFGVVLGGAAALVGATTGAICIFLIAKSAIGEYFVAPNAAVIGTVSAVDVHWNEDQTLIQTYVTLDIQQQIAGETIPSRIVLEEMGGRVGRMATRVEGVPVYRVGEQVFVFVERIDARYRTLGFYQGKYTLEIDSATGKELFVQRVPAGAVYVAAPDGMAEPVAQSYGRDELIAQVRSIAGK